MFSRVFRNHGQFCARHPWEVIIGTLIVTSCLFSMSVLTGVDKICGWNYVCMPGQQDTGSSDVIVLTVTRSLAVMYIYLQFRSLRKLGSKYLLGIAGLFTMFSSFVFSSALINLLEDDLTGLNEALPFFLLLVDLSKASALARFALSSVSQNDIKSNIAQGMAVLGPVMTLDALVETLVIGVGTLSGVKRLEAMCCFGCLSVIANYLAFMTFYPACLALVLEMTRNKGPGRPKWHLPRKFAKLIQDEKEKSSNPVTQRVKVIMSAGLVLVHAHSRWLTEADPVSSLSTHISKLETSQTGTLTLETSQTGALPQRVSPNISLWQFYITRFFTLNKDYAITLVLIVVLSIKYIFFDSDIDRQVVVVRSAISEENMPATEVTQEVKFQSDGELSPTSERDISERAQFIVGADSSDEDVDKDSKETQTDLDLCRDGPAGAPDETLPTLRFLESHLPLKRSLDHCFGIFKSDEGPSALTDDEILMLVESKHIPAYKLESCLQDYQRGVSIRRKLVSEKLVNCFSMDKLPFKNYDFSYVDGACCENVVGYMPVPVGVAGPLLLNENQYYVPMATTEGCLVASTNRGCRAVALSGGVSSTVISDGMTRAPVVRLPTSREASEVKLWLDDLNNLDRVRSGFDSTSRFCRLKKIKTAQAGRLLYLRFVAFTGDAMGMNMLSKGSEKALSVVREEFPHLEVVSLSGNYCTDKKPAAVNWIEGRGKSVVCEAVIPAEIVKTVLKTSVSALVDLNIQKNLIGSAMAGSIGGFNAHASNVVAAVFIATGQDPAQTVASSNCMTLMEATGVNQCDLLITCTMPSIEVGTVGGGTVLPPQASCLEMLGVRGASNKPGENSRLLASIVCGTVLAAELSLMSALAAGHLVKSHLTHNRSSINMAASDMNQAKNGSSTLTNGHRKSSSGPSKVSLSGLKEDMIQSETCVPNTC